MQRADYDFYVTDFGGMMIPSEEFDALRKRAEHYLQFVTAGRALDYERDDAVRLAVCAVAECYFCAGTLTANKRVKSESAGSFSRAYREEEPESPKRAARRYLSHTGLLFRGCRDV